MTNYEALLSGAIGILAGAILSSFITHKLNLSLMKKNFIFKEKAKHYDRTLTKINQIQDWYRRAILSEDPDKAQEIIRRLKAAERIMEHFLKLDPPNFNYVSTKIKKDLIAYHKFLKTLKHKDEYSAEELRRTTCNIDLFTNRIRKQISKELK